MADIKTFNALGLYGLGVATAITAQNSQGVRGYEPVAPAMIREQLLCLFEEFQILAAKTGMLPTRAIIKAVASLFRGRDIPLVVDPVMAAGRGGRLMEEDALEELKNELFPLARVVTPNMEEATSLTGLKVTSPEGMAAAAQELARSCQSAVLVKGGHLPGPAIDLLYYQGEIKEFSLPHLAHRDVHGTGCAFSASLAAGLALGLGLEEAIQRAKQYVWKGIEAALPAPGGWLLFNHQAGACS